VPNDEVAVLRAKEAFFLFSFLFLLPSDGNVVSGAASAGCTTEQLWQENRKAVDAS